MSLFLSYDWEEDTLNRVDAINTELEMKGVHTYFEETRIAGDISGAMKENMDVSEMVVCFITAKYLRQLQSPEITRPSWCRREWAHAHKVFDSSSIIMVLLDPEVLEGELNDYIHEIRDESVVLDFTTDDSNIEELIHAYKEHKEMVSTGKARRARAKQSFVENPVDWEETERTLYYPNGDIKYVGTLLFGKMHGHGTYFYRNKDRYEGEFSEDYFCGAGTYYYSSGARFEGHFRYDRREGPGSSFRVDGSLKYQGEYAGGVRDGRGTEYDEESKPVRDVEYEDGDLINVFGYYEGEGEGDPADSDSARSTALSMSTAGSKSTTSTGKSLRKSLSRRLSSKKPVRVGRFKIPK
ncbi:Phosphatidylinositol 4-phosphate 5-kinase 1 [Hondaea fermentalgiana]|uniref:Phosphatidylinositol 4-phosphate 5-kinase 1 n=1 Tax=Hondaea fermentalgiana TaxID=2315210 RepID=A0A2R5GW28_9STRA|nr:Phosphatidylinositol 4-phosphate 5-kinase 1 [Hondaea fermentalgiana]|eukprot:GBG32873.1 Phosphatidylinositol 4-phosphate 5-kinase 1 [Hondaea fermentalgiana]